MTKFKLGNIERKTTSTGKPMIGCSALEGEIMHEGVAIWSDFPRFADLKDGDEVEAEMVIKQNGQYQNKSLKYPAPAKTNSRSAYMETVVEKKQAGIAQSQDRKEEGIKMSSTIRMATDVVIARMGASPEFNWDKKQIQDEIQDWRRYFWKHWTDPEDPQYSEPF